MGEGITQLEDIRLEIMWYCKGTEGELWPDEIADYLVLDICEVIEAMGMLADAKQIREI